MARPRHRPARELAARRLLARHSWDAAVVACAAVAAFAGAASVLLPGHPRHAPAAGCGLVTCAAALPSANASPPPLPPRQWAGRPLPQRARPRTVSHPSQPPPSAAPPSAAPPPRSHHPAHPPGPRITVTYTVGKRRNDDFAGQFTIINRGSRPLENWVVTATFPGDRVAAVFGASARVQGGTLTLTPAPYRPAIPPGGSQVAIFSASGPTAWPASCTADGRGCG